MKISLAIIAKDEVEQLQRIIYNYGQYFDEVVIAYDDAVVREKLVRDKTIKLFKYEWINDFAHKRNFLHDKVTGDYYFTIDTDDEIENAEGIKALAEKAVSLGIDVVCLYYKYSVDQDGNCNAAHYKERLIKKADYIEWNKPIHENVLHKDRENLNMVIDESVKVIHNIDYEHAVMSAERNLRYLIDEFNRDKDKTDPRTLAYLGRTFMALGKLDEAIPFLNMHVQRSGWDEDRYMSYVQLAEIFRKKDRQREAIAACNEALVERPDYPDAYLKLGEIYFDKQHWKKAIEWTEMGLRKERKDSFMLFDPSASTWRPALLLAYCYKETGDIEKAYKLFLHAKKIAPSLDYIIKTENLYHNALIAARYLDKFMYLYQMVKEEPAKVRKLLEAAPKEMDEHEIIIKMRNKYYPPKKWADKSVAIYCGSTLDEWTPKSIESGIGGSEEAVIYLSKELAKLGHQVTVFNRCGEEGEYDGVKYLNFYKFNPNDIYDVVIGWRGNPFEVCKIKAKRKLVWLHDVIREQTVKGWENVDKFIVLSEFHKSLMPKYVPEDRIFVSSNGINIADFIDTGVKRNPHRIIYASSYDRGLQYLLEMWGDIKKEVPDAKLDIYYGWNNYAKLAAEGIVDENFMTRMQELMTQDGVKEHGRIGHKELIKEMQGCGIWAYPCHFEEISCIVAMKAQACGCLPVVTDYAALGETVKGGIIIKGNASDPDVYDEFKDKLIDALKTAPECPRIEKEQFGWGRVAKEWSESLFPFKRDILEYRGKDDYISHYREQDEKNVSPLRDGITTHRFNWCIEFAKKKGLKRGLDIGTFDGNIPIRMYEENGMEYDGIDINKDFTKIGIDYIRANKIDKVKIYPETMFEDFNPGKKYDLITALEVIEHVIDISGMYRKIDSIVDVGGYILVSTPHKDGVFGETDHNHLHIRAYDEKTIVKDFPPNWHIVEMVTVDELLCVAVKKE
jgi:glycosyltransferase involved in cell wall biosynthesis/2-polyprenyl-3-methyl-5-hydroxy-6-metoxy-1,4-benzoquinol methylase